MLRPIAGLIAGGIFIAFLVYATLAESRVECEVCIEFRGRQACRSGTAVDRNSAVRAATASACAVLSRGVTEGIRCDQTPPRSRRCAE